MAPQRRRRAADEEDLAAEPEDAEPEDAEPEDRDGQRPAGSWEGSALTASEAAKAALHQIMELTEIRPEGITGVQRTTDGWSISFEVVEDRRIPSSADILATYETTVDSDGELMSYRRVKRYSRGRGDDS